MRLKRLWDTITGWRGRRLVEARRARRRRLLLRDCVRYESVFEKHLAETTDPRERRLIQLQQAELRCLVARIR